MDVLVSFAIRFVQAATLAAPYVICGLMLAGVLRVLVSPSKSRSALNGDAISGPLRGWVFGLLLPVCSLGALPICRELLRQGVSQRTVFAFLMAAPLFHPLTLAYALSVMDITLLAVMLACSAVVVTLCAQLILAPKPTPVVEAEATAVEPNKLPFGIRRMIAIVVVATEQLRRPYLVEIAVGLLGAGLVGGLLRPDAIGGALASDGRWAGPLACSLGSAIYMTPDQGINVFDQMFGHGNSLAAAFALLICGVGMNLGTLMAIRNLFGTKSLLAGLAAVFVIVTAIGALTNATVYKPEVSAFDNHVGHEGVDHTHAFDPFAQPYQLQDTTPTLGTAWRVAAKVWSPLGLLAALLLAALACAGAVVRQPKNRAKLRQLLMPDGDHKRADSVMQRPLSAKWLIASFLLICGVLGYVALLAYYPDAQTMLDGMQSVHADAQFAVRGGRTNEAHSKLAELEQSARQLAMGALLRGEASGDRRVCAQHLRQQIAALRVSIDAGDSQQIERSRAACEAAYRQCRAVFIQGQPFVMHKLDDEGMPSKVTDEAERELYLMPGGIYTEADIASNGRQTASEKFAGFRSTHDMNPPPGSLICPITFTKANPACTWVVNGKTYQFCCPPCVDEFVRIAKESPEQIKEPEEYVKPGLE